MLTGTITATVLAVNGYLLYDLLRQQVGVTCRSCSYLLRILLQPMPSLSFPAGTRAAHSSEPPPHIPVPPPPLPTA